LFVFFPQIAHNKYCTNCWHKKQKQWLDLFLFISYPNRSSYLLKKKKQCTEMEQK